MFRAHDIGYFFYNGGNDSMDTALKVSQIGAALGYPITCVGVPKTVDNDLPHTDCCPGFGSVAKYVAVSTREAALDVASMARTSTQVFVLEVMGRHAGWIAAAGGLAGKGPDEPPHIILFPEVPFERDEVPGARQAVRHRLRLLRDRGLRGRRAIADGRFLADAGTKDAFGHTQLGGVAPVVANMVREAHGYKYHWAVADYLQRSARHIASRVDVEQAYAVGKAAVELGGQGRQRRDADHRAQVLPALPLGHRPRAARGGRQPGEEAAAATTSARTASASPAPAGVTSSPSSPGEAYPPYKRRPARLRAHQGRAGAAQAQGRTSSSEALLRALMSRERRVGISTMTAPRGA